MLRSARNILGHRSSAKDGDVGRCVDFLVDANEWLVRYLVVETGSWLPGRRVLISPFALSKADWTSRRLVFEGTRAQVASAPLFDDEAPISRGQELDLFRHYGWSTSELGPVPEPIPLSEHGGPPPMGPGLRSVKEILSYGLEAEDGNVGHVDDFIVDDDTWLLRHLVVSGRNWLSGHRVLIPTERILGVDWEDRQVEVTLPSAAIEKGPQFDPSAPVYDVNVATGTTPVSPGGRPPMLPAWLTDFVACETWGTRGLRAALARIIHG